MNDMTIEKTISEAWEAEAPQYEPPTLKVMDQDEVLKAFQMTAAEISAAGCWWGSC
jgi:hypothetical protein